MTNFLRHITVIIALLTLTFALHLASTGKETIAIGLMTVLGPILTTIHKILKDCD